MKKELLSLLLLIISCFEVRAENSQKKYFGTWAISSYKSQGNSSSLNDEFAKKQIGKILYFDNKNVEIDRNTLWFDNKIRCAPKYIKRNISYFENNTSYYLTIIRDNNYEKNFNYFNIKSNKYLNIGFQIIENNKFIMTDIFLYYIKNRNAKIL